MGVLYYAFFSIYDFNPSMEISFQGIVYLHVATLYATMDMKIAILHIFKFQWHILYVKIWMDFENTL